MQHHIQRLNQRQQLRRKCTAERPDSVAIGPDGVLDLVRLGLASLGVTAQILGKLGEASRVQPLLELLDRGRAELEWKAPSRRRPSRLSG